MRITLHNCKLLLTPEILLGPASRQEFIAKLKELPTFTSNITARKEAAVLVPLCVVSDEVCLLYTLRSLKLTVYSGRVSFPGGKIENNEDAFQAAKRETEEEIGFSSKDIDIWAKMPVILGRSLSINITPVVAVLINYDPKKLNPNDEEVAEVFTVPTKLLSNKKNHGSFIFDNMVIPVYSGGKHKVLGLTGIITHLFLKCFLPKEVYQPDFLRKIFLIDDLIAPSSYPKL